MKNRIVIITFVTLVIGYIMYESDNLSNEINELSTVKHELSTKSVDNVLSEETEVQHGISITEQEHHDSGEILRSEEEVINLEDSYIDDYTQEPHKTKVNEYSEMEKIALQEQELSDWALEHKEWVYQMLQSKAEVFSDRAFTNSLIGPFIWHLDDNDKRSFQNLGLYREVPILLQEPEIDDVWANITEIKIREIIDTQIQDNNFQLYSVTCKQLTCEIIGAEYFPGSWASISLYLSGQLRNSIPVASGWGSSVMGQNGVKYIYRILLFM